MKAPQLWQVAVKTSPEAEEAVCELLSVAFSASCSSFHDLEGRTLTVSTFLARDVAFDAVRRRAAIEGLQGLRAAGLDAGPATLVTKPLPRVNWAEAWKKHFRPIRIGSSLLIRPSWSKASPRKGQAVVELDPGLSFGTGQHPTTEHCLRELARCQPQQRQASLLDIGTGSGILAIAAAKLGYRPVYALDNDPEAVRMATQNGRRNRVQDRITFATRDVLGMRALPHAQYTMVCANLLADLLVSIRAKLVQWCVPGGIISVAGILDREFQGVQKALTGSGLEFLRSRRRGEWRSGTFQRP